jgi:hypothetical protein
VGDSQVQIAEGLKAGERVVSEGQFRLKPGSKVKPLKPASAGDADRGRDPESLKGEKGAVARRWWRRRAEPRAAAARPMRGRAMAPSRRSGAARTVRGLFDAFIRRPIATSLLMGAAAARHPRLPRCRCRRCRKSTRPAWWSPPSTRRDATTMASLVTTPLERQFGQISGLD